MRTKSKEWIYIQSSISFIKTKNKKRDVRVINEYNTWEI